MMRQCAWCLCLIDDTGERISPAPWPKLYEATHGICGTCGIQWMEQVMAADEASEVEKGWRGVGNDHPFPEIERQEQQEERHETITQLILQLQQNPTHDPIDPWVEPTKKTRLL